MYIDITTKPACCCALVFKNNNGNEYVTQGKNHWQAFGTDNFSVECWIRPEMPNAYLFLPIVSYYRFNTNNNNFWRLDINRVGLNFFPRFIIGYQVGVIPIEWESAVNITLGNWYHIVVNKIGSNRNDFEMFINGVRVNHKPFTDPLFTGALITAPNETNYGFEYGRYQVPSDVGYYSGALAQVRLYTGTLGIAEVKFNHEFGFFKPYSIEQLRMWTPFNNCLGTATGVIAGSINAGAIQAAFLGNFGTRTAPLGGAWISDCFEQPGLSCWDHTGDISCKDPKVEDNLVINNCDQITMPHMFPFDNFPGEESGLIFPTQGVGLSYVSCDKTPYPGIIVNQRYESYIYMAWAISNIIPLQSQFQLAYSLCIDNIAVEQKTGFLAPSSANLHAYFNLIENAVENDMGHPHALTLENGEFKFKLGLGSCQDITFLTRKITGLNLLDYETDPFYDVVFTRRVPAYACDTPVTCPLGGSYIIINYVDLCLTKTQEITCVADKVIDITMPCSTPSIREVSETIDCAEQTVTANPRMSFFVIDQDGNYGLNFFSQPVELGRDCESMLIRYRNDDQIMKVQRVRANCKKGGYKKQQEISTSSKGITRKLMSQIHDTYELETDFYSRPWHDEMLKALECDFVEVFINGDWKRVVLEESYSIDWDEEAMPLRGKGNATLNSYNYKYVNTFC